MSADFDLRWQNCKSADAQIYYMMYLMERHGPMTREEISRMMDMDGDSVRVMASILREWDFLRFRQSRMVLTEQGLSFFRDIPVRIVPVVRSEYVIGHFQQGVLVRGASGSISNGTEQRDHAILAGAVGATVMTVSDGDLVMPTNWNLDVREPELAASIRSSTGIGEGDALVITGSGDPETAMLSAISVGLDLL